MPDLGQFVDAYDTRTGAKQTVPAVWLEKNLFPHLSKTPKSKSSPAAGTTSKEK